MGLHAENGATLLVLNKNKLVERKALVDTAGVESAELKEQFLFLSSVAFRTSLDVGKGRKLSLSGPV